MHDAADLPWRSELLARALELKRAARLPHAVLITTTGASNIGRFISSLAQLLLCDAPSENSPCHICEACRLMSAGTYPDFKWVVPETDEKTKKTAKTIKIEQIRHLIHDLALTAQYERLKIAAIYPAEAMTIACANALLKTLEEPAEQVLMILATHNRGRVPVTLRSRCQAWNLRRPSTIEALDWLASKGFDDASAKRYLDFAAGDPLLAIDLQQQDYADIVDRFKPRLSAFIRDELSVADLLRDLGSDLDLMRRLLYRSLDGYCRQTCGVDANANSIGKPDPARARALFDLRQRAQKQLLVEQNNLDFQLQLEDVLISLKQILTRSRV